MTDTGIGMDENQLGRLFRRFTQADASTTRRFGGTGLGLSITKAFANMLGGDIAVQSTPGKGSVFTLKLPVDAQERQGVDAQSRDELADMGADGDAILIVDDDPMRARCCRVSLHAKASRRERQPMARRA